MGLSGLRKNFAVLLAHCSLHPGERQHNGIDAFGLISVLLKSWDFSSAGDYTPWAANRGASEMGQVLWLQISRRSGRLHSSEKWL